MRRISFGPLAVRDALVEQRLREIERASNDNDPVQIAQAFTITGSYTETRTLDAGTATLADLRAFIATFINDLKRGGQNRTV